MKDNIINLFENEEVQTPKSAWFSVLTAKAVGIDKALILTYIRYALTFEKTYNIEDNDWFRASNKELATIFAYQSIQKTLYLVRDLISTNFIVMKKFPAHNPAVYKFYVLTQKGWDI